MLTLLKIKNIALIDDLTVEFGEGLNLLTGETGSGKSIIVDSLGALTGERVSGDLIKDGQESAVIEGLFAGVLKGSLRAMLADSGVADDGPDGGDLIVRRELSAAGKNRVFVNHQLVTQGFLKSIGSYLVDIHGQGEQAALYDTNTHLALLDAVAGAGELKSSVAAAFDDWSAVRSELAALKHDEAEKLQLTDILRFQVTEIEAANLQSGEDAELEEEKLRLNNVEKLTTLSGEAFALLYDDEASTAATLEKAERRVNDLAEYDPRFAGYKEQLAAARAVIEDLAIAARDFSSHLEFSPERLAEIEDRLAEISRLNRKYGGSIDSVLEHLRVSRERLDNIETAEFREQELNKRMAVLKSEYVNSARKLHDTRLSAAAKFKKQVERDLAAVALDKAKFEVRFEDAAEEPDESLFTAAGFDRVEFYFSANPGEPPKPLARVASGGEASRLMLILKTAARGNEAGKTVVFDEIDAGIGGRAAEAVGRKLKDLAGSQQVLCVTHQPQIASLADRHLVVEKAVAAGRTTIGINELNDDEQVEEIARMLAGEHITDAARANARAMLALKSAPGAAASG
jgi:DNA repair protein RecN (Recombination protein N)